jgi:large subunit ribosomal protein L21
MSFAVIKTGGKQYLVNQGQMIKIEKMAGDFQVGSKVTFDQVLMRHDGTETTVGAPTVGGNVTGEIVEIGKLPTIHVVKYKSKSRYFKKNGHRQPYFKVKIESI